MAVTRASLEFSRTLSGNFNLFFSQFKVPWHSATRANATVMLAQWGVYATQLISTGLRLCAFVHSMRLV